MSSGSCRSEVFSMQVYDYKVVRINADMNDGKVVLSAEGALAAAAEPILKRINNVFREEKPISVTDDSVIFSTWVPPMPGPVFNRMINAEIGSSVLKKRTPDQISVGVTPRCPNKCAHCGASDMMRPNSEMTVDEIINIIDQGLDMGTYLVTIDGGEPMMRNDIPDIVSRIDKTKTTVSMFTSGFRLSEERAKALKEAGLYSVKVSFDSPDAEKHDAFRGRKGSFEDAVNAMKNARSAGLMTDLYLTISPYNIDRIDDLYSLACDLNASEMSMTGIIAVGNWKDHEDEVLTRSDAKRLEAFHRKINSEPGGPRVSALPYLLGPDMFGCFAGNRWMHIASTGDVLPCPYTPLTFGNIRNEPLADIWKKMGNHPAYRKKSDVCLMRDPEFREKYIHTIPAGEKMPYPVYKLRSGIRLFFHPEQIRFRRNFPKEILPETRRSGKIPGQINTLTYSDGRLSFGYFYVLFFTGFPGIFIQPSSVFSHFSSAFICLSDLSFSHFSFSLSSVFRAVSCGLQFSSVMPVRIIPARIHKAVPFRMRFFHAGHHQAGCPENVNKR